MKTKAITTILLTLFLLVTVIGMAQAGTQVELKYDDGTPNQYAWGWQFAVRFSLPTGWTYAKILTAKYFFYSSNLLSFEVNIYDSDGTTELITPFSVTPTAGWFNVDLSSLNIVVDDDFYIVIEWFTDQGPYIGQDFAAPIDMRSYWRNSASDSWTLQSEIENMIRAVVEEQEEPPGIPEFPLGWTIEIMLVPIVIYLLWKTRKTSTEFSRLRKS